MISTPQENIPTNALAVVSLVSGVLGLVGVMPIIGSIAAIVAGRMARREINAAPEASSGVQLARAGEVLGWLGVILTALGCSLFFVIVVFIAGPQMGAF